MRQFAAPSPSEIKRAVLLRHGVEGATWVETGTFMGDTAALLSQSSAKVFTIEPDEKLHSAAVARFQASPHVHAMLGTSEDIFPTLLPTLKGHINFWLDGHYSGGITFQGQKDCPVHEELAGIQENLRHFDGVVVLIDDVRCFKPKLPEFKDYPDLDHLVDWARRNGLSWSIEHDIFVAKSE